MTGKHLSALAHAKEVKRNATRVIKCGTKRQVETADKPTTVFDTNHKGYNALDDLGKCPVCLSDMLPIIVNSTDGREIPSKYCLLHRACLPQTIEE